MCWRYAWLAVVCCVLPASAGERRRMLDLVSAADRSADQARTVLDAAVNKSRGFFKRAESGMKKSQEAGAAGQADLANVTQGLAELLAGMKRADGLLSAAAKSLGQAKQVGADLSVTLARKSTALDKELLRSAEDLETQRKRVKAFWERYRSPRLAADHRALRDAKALVEVNLSVARALWRVSEEKRARVRHNGELRRRLAAAGAAIERGRKHIRRTRRLMAEYGESLVNPLDKRRPRPTFDLPADWPAPLRARLEPLTLVFKPPKAPGVPAKRRLRDSVIRFVKGGSP